MGLDELEVAWNAQADKFNQWQDLGLDEIVAFAQEEEREASAKRAEKYMLEQYGNHYGVADAVRSNAEISPPRDAA